jgi:hypothetical protein
MRLSSKKGAHAGSVWGCVQEIRGISLVFRDMWDTTVFNAQFYRLSLGPERSVVERSAVSLFGAFSAHLIQPQRPFLCDPGQDSLQSANV